MAGSNDPKSREIPRAPETPRPTDGPGPADVRDRPPAAGATGPAGARSEPPSAVEVQAPVAEPEAGLVFLAGRELTASGLRDLLAQGERAERAWAVSQLLRHAPWSEIWRYVDRPEVIDLFDELDLPPSLEVAWARQLGIDSPGSR